MKKPRAPAHKPDPVDPPRTPTLVRQKQDFTDEGSPPPGCVGREPPRQPEPAATPRRKPG